MMRRKIIIACALVVAAIAVLTIWTLGPTNGVVFHGSSMTEKSAKSKECDEAKAA